MATDFRGKWYYTDRAARTHGPVKVEDLRELYASRDVDNDTFVWNSRALDKWVQISQVSGLEAHLSKGRPVSGTDYDETSVSSAREYDRPPVDDGRRRSSGRRRTSAQLSSMASDSETTGSRPRRASSQLSDGESSSSSSSTSSTGDTTTENTTSIMGTPQNFGGGMGVGEDLDLDALRAQIADVKSATSRLDSGGGMSSGMGGFGGMGGMSGGLSGFMDIDPTYMTENELSSQIAQHETDNIGLKKQLMAQRNAQDSYAKVVGDFEALKKRLEDEANDLTDVEAMKNIATLQAKNAQLKAEIENLKSEHEDAISRIDDDHTEQIARLKKRFNNDVGQLQMEYDAREEDIDNARMGHMSSQQRINKLAGGPGSAGHLRDAAAAHGHLADMQGDLKVAEMRMEGLRDQLAKLNNEIRNYRRKELGWEKQRQEMQMLADNLAAKVPEDGSMTIILNGEPVSLETLMNAKAKLEGRVRTMKQELEKSRDTIRSIGKSGGQVPDTLEALEMLKKKLHKLQVAKAQIEVMGVDPEEAHKQSLAQSIGNLTGRQISAAPTVKSTLAKQMGNVGVEDGAEAVAENIQKLHDTIRMLQEKPLPTLDDINRTIRDIADADGRVSVDEDTIKNFFRAHGVEEGDLDMYYQEFRSEMGSKIRGGKIDGDALAQWFHSYAKRKREETIAELQALVQHQEEVLEAAQDLDKIMAKDATLHALMQRQKTREEFGNITRAFTDHTGRVPESSIRQMLLEMEIPPHLIGKYIEEMRRAGVIKNGYADPEAITNFMASKQKQAQLSARAAFMKRQESIRNIKHLGIDVPDPPTCTSAAARKYAGMTPGDSVEDLAKTIADIDGEIGRISQMPRLSENDIMAAASRYCDASGKVPMSQMKAVLRDLGIPDDWADEYYKEFMEETGTDRNGKFDPQQFAMWLSRKHEEKKRTALSELQQLKDVYGKYKQAAEKVEGMMANDPMFRLASIRADQVEGTIRKYAGRDGRIQQSDLVGLFMDLVNDRAQAERLAAEFIKDCGLKPGEPVDPNTLNDWIKSKQVNLRDKFFRNLDPHGGMEHVDSRKLNIVLDRYCDQSGKFPVDKIASLLQDLNIPADRMQEWIGSFQKQFGNAPGGMVHRDHFEKWFMAKQKEEHMHTAMTKLGGKHSMEMQKLDRTIAEKKERLRLLGVKASDIMADGDAGSLRQQIEDANRQIAELERQLGDYRIDENLRSKDPVLGAAVDNLTQKRNDLMRDNERLKRNMKLLAEKLSRDHADQLREINRRVKERLQRWKQEQLQKGPGARVPAVPSRGGGGRSGGGRRARRRPTGRVGHTFNQIRVGMEWIRATCRHELEVMAAAFPRLEDTVNAFVQGEKKVSERWRDKHDTQRGQRKQLFKKLQDQKGYTRSFVRIRPKQMFENRWATQIHDCVRSIGDGDELCCFFAGDRHTFEFDKVFNHKNNNGNADAIKREQEELFKHIEPPGKDVDDVDGPRMVSQLLAGYNSTIVCYGPALSGKSHTIWGHVENHSGKERLESWGLAPRSINALLKAGRNLNGYNISISAHYTQIYDDEVIDLLYVPDGELPQPKNAGEVENIGLCKLVDTGIREANLVKTHYRGSRRSSKRVSWWEVAPRDFQQDGITVDTEWTKIEEMDDLFINVMKKGHDARRRLAIYHSDPHRNQNAHYVLQFKIFGEGSADNWMSKLTFIECADQSGILREASARRHPMDLPSKRHGRHRTTRARDVPTGRRTGVSSNTPGYTTTPGAGMYDPPPPTLAPPEPNAIVPTPSHRNSKMLIDHTESTRRLIYLLSKLRERGDNELAYDYNHKEPYQLPFERTVEHGPEAKVGNELYGCTLNKYLRESLDFSVHPSATTGKRNRNATTLFICHVSPVGASAPHTLQTLQFGKHARGIAVGRPVYNRREPGHGLPQGGEGEGGGGGSSYGGSEAGF